MNQQKNWWQILVVISGAAAMSLTCGCAAGEGDETIGSDIAPLVVDGAVTEHLGTYSISTGTMRLHPRVIEDSKVLAGEMGIVEPRVVVLLKETQRVFRADEGDIKLPEQLSVGTQIAACVIEPSTALAWRIANVHIGTSDALVDDVFTPMELGREPRYHPTTPGTEEP